MKNTIIAAIILEIFWWSTKKISKIIVNRIEKKEQEEFDNLYAQRDIALIRAGKHPYIKYFH